MGNVLEYRLFMNGEWHQGSSGRWMDVIYPGNGEVVARVPNGTTEDIDHAVGFAKKAFDSGVWSDKSVGARVKVLSKVASIR